MTSLKELMGYAEGRGRLVVRVEATDAYHSNPIFHWGDRAGTYIGAPIYPVISSWGRIYESPMHEGRQQQTSGEITVLADAYAVSTSHGARRTMAEWFSAVNFLDAIVGIYQAHEWDTASPTLIWKGRITGISDAVMSQGALEFEILMGPDIRALEVEPLGDLVTRAAFATCPISSIGGMVPCVFGRQNNNLFSGANRNSLAWMGFPMAGTRGIAIDENLATVQAKIRFGKHFGVAGHTFAEPTTGDPRTAGDLWIYERSMGCYGLVDNASYSFVNDTSKLEVLVDASPRVYFFIRPSLKGSKNAAGFTDLNKLIDSDPNNYVESTSTDYIWAFLCPEVTINGTVRAVTMILDIENVHATKNRTIRTGLWDVYETTLGAGLLNAGAGSDISKVTGGPRSLTFLESGGGTLFKYLPTDFRNHNGRDTIPEFKSGRFITADTADANEANLELYAEVLELGGAHSGRDQVRLRGMTLMVEMDYPLVPRYQSFIWFGQGSDEYYKDRGRYALQQLERGRLEHGGRTTFEAKEEAARRLVGTEFFRRGIDIKDDGSGTVTGAAGADISKPCDVARFLLLADSESINTTAASLGNFDDARASGGSLNVIDDTNMWFGPEEVTTKQALTILTRKFPMRLHKQKGVWNCIPDDLNPHSSRNYRSTSDDVWIGPNDIIDLQSFRVSQMSRDEIVNSVIFKYSHGFPDREAAAQYAYTNPLSSMYFGVKDTAPIEEPFVLQDILGDAASGSAQAMAEWLGRRRARLRQYVECGLTEKYYDLQVGHTTEFRGLEDVGIRVTAYRAGLTDYHFQSASGATNYKDSATPLFIAASGSGEMYLLTSQQVDGFDFYVTTPAAYTTVASGWEYAGIGLAYTALTGVTNADAIKSAGKQSVRFTRPRADLVYKHEVTINGALCGPCYAYRMKYTGASATGVGYDRTSYARRWEGRRFETLRVTREMGASGRYPGVRAFFQEVM